MQTPIDYYMEFERDFLHMNQVIGKSIQITHTGYQCLNCNLDRPIYRQGFCRTCFFETPKAGDWIMKPELSKAHLNIQDRDLEYEKKMQLQPHIVYLANSSDVKVGVTRKKQIPTRWIDQGAHEALVMAEVPNRYLAGIIEVALKAHVSDKTSWQRMLKNEVTNANLKEWRISLSELVPEETKKYLITDSEEIEIKFPVLVYPDKIKSVKLEKTPRIEGKLVGIKGQYLIFEGGRVINIRAHEGFVVALSLFN